MTILGREPAEKLAVLEDDPLGSLDVASTPIYRANHSVRRIQLPKGRHEVRFTYGSPGFTRGLKVTVLAITTLLIWVGGAVYMDRRVRR